MPNTDSKRIIRQLSELEKPSWIYERNPTNHELFYQLYQTVGYASKQSYEE